MTIWESPVAVQFLISAATLGSAWMTHRVWRGRKTAHATAGDTPVPLPVRFDDPSTPHGFTIQRLDNELRAAQAELSRAREQRSTDIGTIARLEAKVLALEEDKTWLERRVLELEALRSAHGY